MKTIYTLTISDIKDSPVNHLPITLKTRFRSFDRVSKIARNYHAENRSILIAEHNDHGFVACWEMEAGESTVIFSDN